MKTRPIIFRPEMVRAILDGKKTVTRRIVKPGKNPFESPMILWVRESVAVISGLFFLPARIDYLYAADGKSSLLAYRPSMYMPKAACRLRLLVSNVSMQWLHEIDECDAAREGFESRQHFIRSWERHNGNGSFSRNQFVWRIEFEIFPKEVTS